MLACHLMPYEKPELVCLLAQQPVFQIIEIRRQIEFADDHQFSIGVLAQHARHRGLRLQPLRQRQAGPRLRLVAQRLVRADVLEVQRHRAAVGGRAGRGRGRCCGS